MNAVNEQIITTTRLNGLWETLKRAVAASKNAGDYLRGRKFNYRTIEVGFVGRNFQPLLESAERSHLEELGIIQSYKSDKVTSPLKNAIVFPLKDEEGNITGLYGRKMDDEFNKHIFINEQMGVYPNFPKPDTEKLLLTTSVTDAATLPLLPFIKNEYGVMAIHGFDGLNELHIKAIASLPGLREVIIITPTPIKAEPITEALVLHSIRVNTVVVELPIGEDINSLYVNGHEDTIRTLLLIKNISTSAANPLTVSTQNAEDSADEFITDNHQELIYKTSNAKYRVLGGVPDTLSSMKVTVAIHHPEVDCKVFRNRMDLFSYDEIRKESEKAEAVISVRSEKVNVDMNKLASLLEAYRKNNSNRKTGIQYRPVLSQNTVEACKSFLSSKNLFSQIDSMIEGSGIIGEEYSRGLVFAIASSYKMPNALHGILIGDSASGKTTLMNSIANLIPKEDRKSFTRITEGSLFNIHSDELDNKLLLIEDRMGVEEKAQYAIRELQSKGEIISLTTSKNEAGEYGTIYNKVKAKVASLSCSTSGDFLTDDENRCFVIKMDQSAQQTARIIDYQRRFFSGKVDSDEQKKTMEFIQNCIRILHSFEVVNPFAEMLHIPSKVRNQRRLNHLFLSLINQITLLHQYQRQRDNKGRLISTIDDVRISIEIMFDAIVLKADVLEDGLLRDFFERLKEYVKKNGSGSQSFTSRDVREVLMMSKTKVNTHLSALVHNEYIQIAGGSANRGLKYQIIVWDDNDKFRGELKSDLLAQLRRIC